MRVLAEEGALREFTAMDRRHGGGFAMLLRDASSERPKTTVAGLVKVFKPAAGYAFSRRPYARIAAVRIRGPSIVSNRRIESP